MPTVDASELLRPGLLDGVCVLLADLSPDRGLAQAPAGEVDRACAELGARVSSVHCPRDPTPAAEEAAIDRATAAALAELGAVDVLVIETASAIAGRMAGEAEVEEQARARAALVGCLDRAWNVTRAVVNLAFLPAERSGRIVYLAPAAGGGLHAEPARAGLENLARTLSIEWARHRITTVTIAPGAETTAGEVAALTAYLASPAGAYFSGCLLDLRGPAF